MPLAEWTSDLPIHEPLARCPFVDAGSPPDGNTVQSQAIVDDRTGLQRFLRCTPNAEMEKVWG